MNKISKTKLFIFTTSDVPDVYINTIGYSIEHFPKVEKIFLLNIVKDRGLLPRTREYLNQIKSNIARQLSLLQAGKYLYKDQDTRQWQEKEIEIEEFDRRRYALFASHEIDTRVIFYDELDSEISAFIKGSEGNCVFDVSAVLKGYLIDVFVLLVELGSNNIHVFELKRTKRTYDEQELIHNLASDKGDYEYVNLTKSVYTSGKVIQNRAQVEKQNQLEEKLNATIEFWSNTFARWVMGIYLFVVVISFVSLVVIVIRGNWNNYEPWITILFGTPLITYVISIIAQLVFSKKISLEPSNIYDWLKEYKRKQVIRKFNNY